MNKFVENSEEKKINKIWKRFSEENKYEKWLNWRGNQTDFIGCQTSPRRLSESSWVRRHLCFVYTTKLLWLQGVSCGLLHFTQFEKYGLFLLFCKFSFLFFIQIICLRFTIIIIMHIHEKLNIQQFFLQKIYLTLIFFKPFHFLLIYDSLKSGKSLEFLVFW